MACNRRIPFIIAGLVTILAAAGATIAHAARATGVPYRIRQIEHKRAGYYDISAKYPFFLGNSTLAAFANRAIKAGLDKEVRDTRNEAVKYHGTGPFDFPYDLTIDTRVGLTRTDLISLCFDEYEYSGGANGLNYPVTLNFGWRNGKPAELALSDIFAGTGDPLDTLSDAVMPILKKRQASMVTDGEVKNLAGVQGTWGWWLDGKKQIVVEIGQEAVASHAEGSFTLPVSLSSFGSKLNATGPLKAYLASFDPPAAVTPVADPPASDSPTHALAYMIRTVHTTRKGYYAINIKYPVFAGASPIAATANKATASWIDTGVRDLKKGAVAAHGTPMNQPWFLGIDSDVTVSRAGLVSLCFWVHGYYGGATDVLYPHAFTFGVRGGTPAQLNLADLFTGSPQAVDTLSNAVMPILRERKEPFVLDREFPSLGSQSSSPAWAWYLTPKQEIVVVIAEGVVDSHAAGPVTVAVPLTHFGGKLKTDGPLSVLVARSQ